MVKVGWQSALTHIVSGDAYELTRMRHLELFVPERLSLQITPQAVKNSSNRLGYDKFQTFF